MATTAGAHTTRSLFRRTTTVTVSISADPATLWNLLTDADRFPNWNTTVTRIEGPIRPGQKLKVTVPISTRTFTPRVVSFDPPRFMRWQDGAKPMFWGVRDYTLEDDPTTPGSVRFTMTETIRGAMLPLAARSLPDFIEPFTRYAADLKAEAERHRSLAT